MSLCGLLETVSSNLSQFIAHTKSNMFLHVFFLYLRVKEKYWHNYNIIPYTNEYVVNNHVCGNFSLQLSVEKIVTLERKKSKHGNKETVTHEVLWKRKSIKNKENVYKPWPSTCIFQCMCACIHMRYVCLYVDAYWNVKNVHVLSNLSFIQKSSKRSINLFSYSVKMW